MTDSAKYDEGTLLAHAGWVRALARHLTADAHAADDLAQDTLAAALVQPPPSDRPLRGWLAAILRNLARQDRRAAGRRGARERAVARDEVATSTAQSLERLDSLRAVVDAVTRLDEPYRSAILMRYFDGSSPSAIATRTGVPLRTVHTRLHRALARLRAELDRAHGGDRKAWLLALIPFAEGLGGSGWPELGAGALIMDAKLKIALALVALVGVCSTIALWPEKESTLVSAPLAAVSKEEHVDASAPESPALQDAPATVARRAQERASSDATPRAVPPVPVVAKLKGRVIDVERAPVAHAKVRFVDPSHGPKDGVEVEAGADGSFELDDPKSGGHLDIASEGWACVYRPQFDTTAGEYVLVVARSVSLAGTVVDEQHQPLTGATVAVPLPFGMRAQFDSILDRSISVERSTKSDEAGRFEMKQVPLVPGTKLTTTLAAYMTDEREVPAHDEFALELVLRSARAEPEQLLGTVVDVEGKPVEGAWIACGPATAKSGRAGAFALDLTLRDVGGREARSTLVRAVKQGHLPGEVTRANDGAWPSPLVVRLGGPPLSIEGRVVDADGKPIAGAQVWTSDEAHFGYVPIEGGEMTMRAGANVESILRGDPFTHRIQADASGRFALSGLLAHDYRVHALDTQRVLATTASLAAGVRNVELRMPKEDVHERVAGRVTSLSGDPLAGVEVSLERHANGEQTTIIDRLRGASVRTDADGRFEFGPVSRAVNVVGVDGYSFGVTGFERPLDPREDVEDLAIRVPLTMHVQIDAAGRTDFDRVSVLDEHGQKLYLTIQHGSSSYAMQEMDLREGRTEPFSVSEEAKTLVLFKGEVEVQKLPMRCTRGELNTIRP